MRHRRFFPAMFPAALLLVGVLTGRVQAESFVLAGATVHTVTGETLSPGYLLVEDGVIKTVTKNADEIQAPRGVRRLELAGQHIYPGLIALDTTLGLSEISGVRSTRDAAESGDYTPDVTSWVAVNPDSELIPVARANGITYMQPAPQGGIVSGQSGVIALDGWTTEQMVLKKPAALHLRWPDMNLNTTAKSQTKDKGKWKSPEDQGKEREEKLREVADFFTEARAYAQAKQAGKGFEFNPEWEAMLPYVKGELPVMVHADDIRQMKAAVNWAATNQVKIVLVGGLQAAKIAPWLAERKVAVVYERVYEQPPTDTSSYDELFSAPGVLHKAGVTVALGMGADLFDAALVKNLPYTAAQASTFGLGPEETLKALTIVPAQLLGVADKIGSIETGKVASLFVTDGDILDIRTQVKHVWIAGKEVSLETRHTKLYEKYKNRPRPK